MMWAEPAESLGGVYYKIIEPKIHPIRTKWREKCALVFTFITYLKHKGWHSTRKMYDFDP